MHGISQLGTNTPLIHVVQHLIPKTDYFVFPTLYDHTMGIWRSLVTTRPWIIPWQIRSDNGERSRHDHCVISLTTDDTQLRKTQTLQIVLKRPRSLHKVRTRHVHLNSHNFGHQNHTTTFLVWSSRRIPVIRSQKHICEVNELDYNPNTITWLAHTYE